MITKNGRADISTPVKDTFVYAQVGTGGDSTTPHASDLASPIGSRFSVSGTDSGETSVDWKFSVSGLTHIGHTIKEVGIFDASSGGNMLLRVNYDAIGPLPCTDDIEFIITVEVD